MKKETNPKNNTSTYETEVNKKSLQEVIEDLLKSYQANKKVKIVVS
ncbi:MAG: hypothetical protein RLZ75_573 [Pseudomonadota bacterium]